MVLILVVSNQQIQSLQSESHQQTDALQDEILELRVQLNKTSSFLAQIWSLLLGSFSFPLASCTELPLQSPSGDYWITGSSSLVEVYCEKNRQNCSCNSNGWWMKVANLDMTDPNQNCPAEFTTVTRATPPLRTCGRIDNGQSGCVSTTYRTHGVAYTQACGRIKAYQYGSTTAFVSYDADNEKTIDSHYLGWYQSNSWTIATTTHLDICRISRRNTIFQLPLPLYSTRH